MPTKEPGVQRAVAAGPPWLILLSGLTLIAMVVLTPAWLDLRQLAVTQKILQRQADRLVEQASRYQQVYEGLQADDPLLLERLAYTRLNLQPRGKDLLIAKTVATPRATRGLHDPGAGQRDAFRRDATAAAQDSFAGRVDPIDRWLNVPPPIMGEDVSLPPPPDSELTRISRGWKRVGVLVGAGACVLGALLWGGWKSS